MIFERSRGGGSIEIYQNPMWGGGSVPVADVVDEINEF